MTVYDYLYKRNDITTTYNQKNNETITVSMGIYVWISIST